MTTCSVRLPYSAIAGVNRAAPGGGQLHWYGVGVTPGKEKRWAEQLRDRMVAGEVTVVDPATGEHRGHVY